MKKWTAGTRNITGILWSAGVASSGDTPLLSTFATPDGVTLSWDAVDGAIGYEVVEDGVTQLLTSDTQWVDRDVIEGATVEYQVVATTPDRTPYAPSPDDVGSPAPAVDRPHPATSEPRDPPDESSAAADVPPHEELTDGRQVTMGAPVTVPVAADVDSLLVIVDAMQREAAAVTRSELRHRTFIPTSSAPGFPCTFDGDYFGGDDRGYSVGNGTSRTELSAYFDWTSSTITQRRAVSDTTRFNSDGTVDDVRNAGTGGLTIYVQSMNSAQGRARADHSVGNPFCVTGAIDYDWTALVYRTGQYTIEGDHRPAPNHEIYLLQDGAARTVYTADNEGFDCLTGICGRNTIARSTL